MNDIKENITQVINHIKDSIELVISKEFYGAALILIYAGIDAMANLIRPDKNKEVLPSDFIQWVDKYIKFDSKETIFGGEFYSSRCAILHTFGVESGKTKTGRSRMIGFVVGGYPPIRYDPLTAENLVLLDILSFKDSFFNALDDYKGELLSICEKSEIIHERVLKLIQSYPI